MFVLFSQLVGIPAAATLALLSFHGVRIVVEIAGIASPLYAGYDGSSSSSVVYVLPIDAVEEVVIPDSSAATGDMSKSLGRFRLAKGQDEGPGCAGYVERMRRGWESYVTCDDLLVDSHGILIPEGRLSDEHLVD